MTGELLAGRYRLEGPIATGGMGEVWRATDTVLVRRVAIKILSARLADDAAFLARFRHEARTMAALRHPGIAAVYDYGEVTPQHPAYLTMAYVEGRPLSRYIAEVGRLDAADTAHLVAQVAAALHAVHQLGVVHRDVKPGNLILRPDGTVVLVDFGVAHTGGSPSLTDLNEVVGTAMYMAPEQICKQPLSPATDVYALGTVAYHCLAGHPPFEGDSALAVVVRHLTDEPPPLPDDVPLSMRQLVATAMAKDPADRFPTAAALARAAPAPQAPPRHEGPLRAAAAGLASAVTAMMPVSRAGAIWTRRRAATASAGLLGAFAVGAAVALATPTPVRMQTVEPSGSPHPAVSSPAQAAQVSPEQRGRGRTRDNGGSGAWTDQGNAGAGPAFTPQPVGEHAANGASSRPSPSPSTSPSTAVTSPSGSPSASPGVTGSPTAGPTDSASATPDPSGGAQTTPAVPGPSASTTAAGT